MGDKKANLVVTDPPYNVDYEGEVGKIKNDNLEDEEFYKFLLLHLQTWKNVWRDASIYVFHADTEGLNFRKAFKAAASIFLEHAYGRSKVLYLEEALINGSMNLFFMAGRSQGSIIGILIESKVPFGSLTDQTRTHFIQL